MWDSQDTPLHKIQKVVFFSLFINSSQQIVYIIVTDRLTVNTDIKIIHRLPQMRRTRAIYV